MYVTSLKIYNIHPLTTLCSNRWWSMGHARSNVARGTKHYPHHHPRNIKCGAWDRFSGYGFAHRYAPVKSYSPSQISQTNYSLPHRIHLLTPFPPTTTGPSSPNQPTNQCVSDLPQFDASGAFLNNGLSSSFVPGTYNPSLVYTLDTPTYFEVFIQPNDTISYWCNPSFFSPSAISNIIFPITYQAPTKSSLLRPKNKSWPKHWLWQDFSMKMSVWWNPRKVVLSLSMSLIAHTKIKSPFTIYSPNPLTIYHSCYTTIS